MQAHFVSSTGASTRWPNDRAREAAAGVLQTLLQALRTAPPVEGEPSPLRADPARVRQACEAAVRALITLSTETPSQRLLADHTAAVLAGVSTGLNALALLVGHRAQPVPRRGIRTRRPIGCRVLSMRCVRSSPSAPSRDSPPISMEERRSGISH